MRLHYLLLATAIIAAASCNKDEKSTTPLTPTPATTDFREKYVGTFNVTKVHWDIQHPSGKPATRSSQIYTGTVQFGYKMTDSIDDLSSGYPALKLAALSLVYGNGTSQLVGVDTLGQLRYNPIPPSGNRGGFVTLDSIFHVYGDTYTSTSSEDTLYAKRIK